MTSMIKRLLLILSLLACSAVAQNSRFDGTVTNRNGTPIGGASIAVCSQPATTTTTPCTPLASLCSSASDAVCTSPNPVTADSLGNYSGYVRPGKYTLQFYGSGLTTRVQPDQILACDPSNCQPIILTNPTVNGTPTGTGIPTTYLKTGSGAGNYTASNTTYANVDTTNLCQVVTIPAGWKLVISVSGTGLTSTAVVNFFTAIADIGTTCGGAGLTPLVEGQVGAPSTGNPTTYAYNWVIIGDGNAHAISLLAKTTNAADAWLIANSSSTLKPTMVLVLMPSN